MVTDKELKDAFNEYALKAHDIELDLYRKEIIYARHEKIEMDEQPFNYGFHAGAKWMQEKMKEPQLVAEVLTTPSGMPYGVKVKKAR